MFSVIFLVNLLHLGSQSASSTPSLGQAYYHEQESDSVESKISGAAINALIFVATVTVATFGIFLLFKYRCTKVIWGIMGISGISVFLLFGYNIFLAVLQEIHLDIDKISFFIIVWNFCVVGVVSVFFWPGPLTLKQGNLICIAAATAYIFCRLPEWSTFLLLISLALYDLGAVLLPMGPLKILVELAIERDESIPALVYEARAPPKRSSTRNVSIMEPSSSAPQLAASPSEATTRGQRAALSHAASSPAVVVRGSAASSRMDLAIEEDYNGEAGLSGMHLDGEEDALPSAHLILPMEMEPVVAGEYQPSDDDDAEAGDHEPLLASVDRTSVAVQEFSGANAAAQQSVQEGEDSYRIRQDGIKLGLGDFIFYSVLVGRAAMYDMVAAFAAYLAIIAGLVMTLLLLAVFQKALPALPISIFAGIGFYLLARLVLDVMVAGLATNMLLF